MKKGAKRGKLSVTEAMEELSRFAELDEKKVLSNVAQEELSDPEYRESNQEKVKETFRVLHNYLQRVYEKGEGELEDAETRQGIQSIMLMANEAAQKIDKCTALFKGTHGEGGVQELKEFQDLQEFYLNKIMKKFHATLAKEEAWEAEWGEAEVDLLDIQRRGLKDLETVKRDKEYELFFIRKEDGKPFFSRNLLRHIKLVGKFDETIGELTGEDPFLRIKAIEDRTVHEAAREILQASHDFLDSFVKDAVQERDSPLVLSTMKAIMALMLAANPRNLLQQTMGKSSLSYFHDFQLFLREAVVKEDYTAALDKPFEQLGAAEKQAIQILHRLAHAFFTRQPYATEAGIFVETIFSKACHKFPLTEDGKNPLWMWNALVDEDEHLRQYLTLFPNGPLLKTLDVVREGEEHGGFDPMHHENFPHGLFSFTTDSYECTLLRIPSPTLQSHIDQAKIVPEFKAFLRGLGNFFPKKKLLLVNLQDRTSWHEHARCMVLEELQKSAEFSEILYVVTLPKDTEFYLQTGIYEKLDDAAVFKSQLLEQLDSGEGCGFFFPPNLKIKEITDFSKQAVEVIHNSIFGGKGILTRKNRLDFLELFYHFLTFKLIEMTSSDLCSFICKDAIDTSAVMASGFYAFIKMLSKQPHWRPQDKQFVHRLLYQGALMMRERAVDDTRLHRFVGAFSDFQAEIDAQKSKTQTACSALYKKIPLTETKLQHHP